MISYRADSLREAGDKLDDVLMRARERTDVETESIELRTPVSAGPVSLPQIERAAPARTHPAPMRERDGARPASAAGRGAFGAAVESGAPVR